EIEPEKLNSMGRRRRTVTAKQTLVELSKAPRPMTPQKSSTGPCPACPPGDPFSNLVVVHELVGHFTARDNPFTSTFRAFENCFPQTSPHLMDCDQKQRPRLWKNWWVRGILTLAMIAFFFIIIYLGPIVLMMIVMCVQIKCFQEIIMIGYNVYHSYDLPWFRTLSWYFLLCVNYFFYGETVTDYFFTLVQREEPLRILSKYHRFISFALYLTGFCMFVLSLVKKHYRLQFYMFGWTHVTLLIVVTQSHLIIHNLFEGMIWFIVPISCVICNDIMAYMFGFFFGRTPLIKLSPKKTWEGFIGGFFSTVVFGILLSYVMAGYSYFVCPVEFNSDTNRFMVDCEPSDLFQLQEYHIPAVLQSAIGWVLMFCGQCEHAFNLCMCTNSS
ncbi:unnamed protein product, partial [Ranitomeya imitator]